MSAAERHTEREKGFVGHAWQERRSWTELNFGDTVIKKLPGKNLAPSLSFFTRCLFSFPLLPSPALSPTFFAPLSSYTRTPSLPRPDPLRPQDAHPIVLLFFVALVHIFLCFVILICSGLEESRPLCALSSSPFTSFSFASLSPPVFLRFPSPPHYISLHKHAQSKLFSFFSSLTGTLQGSKDGTARFETAYPFGFVADSEHRAPSQGLHRTPVICCRLCTGNSHGKELSGTMHNRVCINASFSSPIACAHQGNVNHTVAPTSDRIFCQSKEKGYP